jgi:hypothetical protein
MPTSTVSSNKLSTSTAVPSAGDPSQLPQASHREDSSGGGVERPAKTGFAMIDSGQGAPAAGAQGRDGPVLSEIGAGCSNVGGLSEALDDTLVASQADLESYLDSVLREGSCVIDFPFVSAVSTLSVRLPVRMFLVIDLTKCDSPDSLPSLMQSPEKPAARFREISAATTPLTFLPSLPQTSPRPRRLPPAKAPRPLKRPLPLSRSDNLSPRNGFNNIVITNLNLRRLHPLASTHNPLLYLLPILPLITVIRLLLALLPLLARFESPSSQTFLGFQPALASSRRLLPTQLTSLKVLLLLSWEALYTTAAEGSLTLRAVRTIWKKLVGGNLRRRVQ